MANISKELEEDVKKQVLVYLEAARYIATCGQYNEQKFDRVQRILSKVGANMSEAQKRQLIGQLPAMVITSATGNPWDDLKAMEHQSLSESVGTFGRILANGSPDARKFLERAILDMKEISRLVGERK